MKMAGDSGSIVVWTPAGHETFRGNVVGWEASDGLLVLTLHDGTKRVFNDLPWKAGPYERSW